MSSQILTQFGRILFFLISFHEVSRATVIHFSSTTKSYTRILYWYLNIQFNIVLRNLSTFTRLFAHKIPRWTHTKDTFACFMSL